jgi:hypothetical protein
VDTSLSEQSTTDGARAPLSTGQTAMLAVACIVGGFLPLSVGYVPGDVARLTCGVLVTGALLALALMVRRMPTLRKYWEIPLAFFGMALFIFADRYVPDLLRAHILHETTDVTVDEVPARGCLDEVTACRPGRHDHAREDAQVEEVARRCRIASEAHDRGFAARTEESHQARLEPEQALLFVVGMSKGWQFWQGELASTSLVQGGDN